MLRLRVALVLAVLAKCGARQLILQSSIWGGALPARRLLDGDLLETVGDEAASQIVGGLPTKEGRYPYVVNLVRFGFLEFCGGTLISPNVVLTAAHCDKSFTSVSVGRHDLGNRKELFERHEVLERAFPTPGFDAYTNDNDVMLLLLGDESEQRPVAVDGGDYAAASERPDGPSLRAMGWGMTAFQGPTSPVLQEVDVDAIPLEACNELFRGAVTANMMCAAGPGKDACSGDSGGPLVLPQDPSKGTFQDVQVGVISWGSGCATYDEGDAENGPTGHPGVYVRLGKYIPWIQQTLASWGAEPARVVSMETGPPRSRLPCASLANYTDRHGEASVCAATKFKGGSTCRAAQAFDDAQKACEVVGARLCTNEELERHETKGTGCGFDFRRVWSSSWCSDGHHITAVGKTGQDPQCTENNSKAAVRCCADA